MTRGRRLGRSAAARDERGPVLDDMIGGKDRDDRFRRDFHREFRPRPRRRREIRRVGSSTTRAARPASFTCSETRKR